MIRKLRALLVDGLVCLLLFNHPIEGWRWDAAWRLKRWKERRRVTWRRLL